MFTIAALCVAVHFGAKIVVMEIERSSRWDALFTEGMQEARELHPEQFYCWDCWIDGKPELTNETTNQLAENLTSADVSGPE